MPEPAYAGRFAPTPSGPLHLGSLLAATASWLDARAHGGRWLLRIDDLDAPRVAPGAESAILACLEAHGLFWDGPVARQSRSQARYDAALRALADRCYACRCTRRILRGAQRYPGTCRSLGVAAAGNALRIRAAAGTRAFDDRVQGRISQDVAAAVGDFIVRRRDGFASYQLAVVVDDAASGVTHVVRGADLLDNTPRQAFLADCLGIRVPAYAHVPVIADATGAKLSKHSRATALDNRLAARNLACVLGLLGLDAPGGSAREMLAWATPRWRIGALPRGRTLRGFAALS